MAFRKKAISILDYRPDILVIPECEHPDKLIFDAIVPKPTDCLWFGQNRNKGLAIISYGNFRLRVIRGHDENLRMIVPISVSDGNFKFNLFAIWANNPGDRDGQYITQVWKAIHKYNRLLSRSQTILIGDFNSNKIWDRPRREGNHTHVVDHLKKKRIHSLYHSAHFNASAERAEQPSCHILFLQTKRILNLTILIIALLPMIFKELQALKSAKRILNSGFRYSHHVHADMYFQY